MKNSSKIKKLIKVYDAKRKKRFEEQAAKQPYLDRMEAIKTAPAYIVTDFFCSVCKRDCQAAAVKQVSTQRELHTAWFTGYCPKGHKLIRRITDKESDPYYSLSMVMKRQRWEMRDAMLTPEDPRFKKLYPKQWKKLWKERIKDI